MKLSKTTNYALHTVLMVVAASHDQAGRRSAISRGGSGPSVKRRKSAYSLSRCAKPAVKRRKGAYNVRRFQELVGTPSQLSS
ncbi:hypothetical protein QFZ77_003350 [Paenibacillus sp. V4I3]|uniref:hypothetical protein n=1 Tax=unclassified Paenibacillus TaxID=185978 RepID=UPI0027898762|nr:MULTISPECIES: hypothetical protein [unclassified Paenibacillus]MDQ0874691.1 hypothetical protein [Paenibacillus sp. V4I3]MDQ0889558.1 hypothetical protein [Paenibacillus sp. V4I9]